MFQKTSRQLILLVVISLCGAILTQLFSSRSIPWIKHWPPYQALAGSEMPEPDMERETNEETAETEVEHQPVHSPERIEQLIVENQGLTDIGLETAQSIHQYGRELTLWIDARSQELYDAGHIEGAHLLDFYNQADRIVDIETLIAEQQPIALVIYCKGKDCHDSHFLAEDMAALGYGNIFIYRDGYQDWYKAGLAVEGVSPSADLPSQENPQKVDAPEEKPPGMYLEHVIRDMIPILFAVFFALMWMRSDKGIPHVYLACIILGAFFIYAGVPKVLNPLAFAKSIWNYDLAPGVLINMGALIMPWLEIVAGIGVMLTLFRRGGSLITAGLLIIFILAVGFNMIRGHEFNCGCTSTGTLVTDLYLEGWNDKILLLLRDVALLLMAWMGIKGQSRAVQGMP